MYKLFEIDGYKFRVNERGWGVVTDNYDGRAIELGISTMRKMIEAYEEYFSRKRKQKENN